MISGSESLTTFWRGDDTEIEALQVLARLYTDEGRYREAFHVMRTAFKAHPNAEMTRHIQDEAAATFEALFRVGKGDALPAVEALALFYDFRELTPIGRRGDEMVRRLSRPPGRRRSARPGGRIAAAPGRPPAAGRRPRRSRGAAWR